MASPSSSSSSCCFPVVSKRRDLFELQKSAEAGSRQAEALRYSLSGELAACQARNSESLNALVVRSRDLESQLAKARVVIGEIQVRNAKLEMQPAAVDLERERKKVHSEFQRKSHAMERTIMEDLEAQRRISLDLQKGQASITALEVRSSSLGQASESLGRQVASCRQMEADARRDLDTLEETIRRLRGEVENLTVRRNEELRPLLHTHNELIGCEAALLEQVRSLEAQAAHCAELTTKLNMQREAHAVLLTEAGVMEERVHRGNEEAAEASAKVNALRTDVQEAKRRAAKAEALLQGTVVAGQFGMTFFKDDQCGQSPDKIALLGKVALKEAEATKLSRELGFAQTDLTRLQKELEELTRQAEKPEDANEVAAALNALETSKETLLRNEADIAELRRKLRESSDGHRNGCSIMSAAQEMGNGTAPVCNGAKKERPASASSSGSSRPKRR